MARIPIPYEIRRYRNVRAKKQGSGHYRFFSLDMLEKAEQDLWLEMALRDAIDKNELEVYYQPKDSFGYG